MRWTTHDARSSPALTRLIDILAVGRFDPKLFDALSACGGSGHPKGTPAPEWSEAINALGWLAERACDYDTRAAIEELLGELLRSPDAAPDPQIKRTLTSLQLRVLDMSVEELLKADRSAASAYDRVWLDETRPKRLARIVADALVGPDGRCDLSALSALQCFLADMARCSPIPFDLQMLWQRRLTQWSNPSLDLATAIDAVADIEDLPAAFTQFMRWDSDAAPQERSCRTRSILLSLLLPVRQRLGASNCWQIVGCVQLHELAPRDFLEDLVRDIGEAAAHDAAVGEARAIERTPTVPQHTSQLMKRPVNGRPSELAQLQPVQALLCELQFAEGFDSHYWQDLAPRAMSALGTTGLGGTRIATLKAMAEAIVAAHLGLAEADMQGDCRQPQLGRRARIDRYHQLCEHCLGFLVAQSSSSLLLAWQNAIDVEQGRRLIDQCWQAVCTWLASRKVDGIDPDSLDHVLQGLHRCFVEAATVRLDDHRYSDVTRGLRLFLRLPSGEGRGVAIDNAHLLGDGLARLVGVALDTAGTPLAQRDEIDWLKAQLRSQAFCPDILSVDKWAPNPDPTDPFYSGWWHEGGSMLWTDPYAPEVHLPSLNQRNARSRHQECRIQLVNGGHLWHADPTRHARPEAARHSLREVLKLLRTLNLSEPKALQQTLDTHAGRVTLASFGHIQNLLALHPSLASGWRDARTPRSTWIDRQLVRPARQALTYRPTTDQATQFIREIVGSCGLKDDGKEMVIERVLADALRRASRSKVPKLKHLVAALSSQLLAPASAGYWHAPDRADELLNAALMNHPVTQPPAVIYADPGWETANVLCFACSPLHRQIEHFAANAQVVPADMAMADRNSVLLHNMRPMELFL
ncbi:MAG: hypothetical protein KF871_06055 [Hydrogenophaga sp.]|uniref:hypothetical protein n=1 Tax=Hydrogenophaga sp. TaxID=1904254 RepID=UPI001D6E689A|nr:hypothetical protein [Hydrogenophaga sp.]MBX3609443.1 hypothetical protein [Hydrogenophaga sp.]